MDNPQRLFLRQAVCQCVQQVFSNFHVDASEHEPDSSLVGTTEPLLVSILGFKSKQMSGTLLLGCDDDFLRATYPTKAEDSDVDAFLGRDWLGEVSNLVAGRLKNYLLAYGLVLKLNPPSISESTYSIFETYSGRLPAERFWFTVQGYQVCLLLCADVEKGFEFKEITPAAQKLLAPGGSILSLKSYRGVDSASSEPSRNSSHPVSAEADLDDEDSTVYINNVPVPEDALGGEVVYDEFETLDEFDESLEDDELSFPLVRKNDQAAEQQSTSSSAEATCIDRIEVVEGGKLKVEFSNGATYKLDLQQVASSSQKQMFVEGHCVEVVAKGTSNLVVRLGQHEIEYKNLVAA